VIVSAHQDLGRYRILEPIGSGGMAIVYRGQHVLLRHQVAVKVLHPHYLSDHAMRRRFLREARIIASLRHPGVVEVFDVGTASDGRVYVAMELLRGEPLSARLRTGKLSERTAITFGRQLASALAAAHDHGVVHRDLKPDNVFLVADDEVRGGERAKVLDFGIAKRVTYIRSGERTGEQTKTGVLLGTPMYMAPEQCLESADIDGRADLYALGIVLYQMVAGAPPFAGGATEEIIAQHMYVEAPPACDAVPGISPAFSAILQKCMAKDRQDRYASADALARDLARLAGSAEMAAVAAEEAEEDAGEVVEAVDDDDTQVEIVDRTRPWQARATGEVRPRRWRMPAVALAGALAGALIVMVGMRGSGETGEQATGNRPQATAQPEAPTMQETAEVEAEAEPPVIEGVKPMVVERVRAEVRPAKKKIARVKKPEVKEDPFAKVQTPALF
jgi:tRNA A-37 threonylcarbamoyl transferase component Bud32